MRFGLLAAVVAFIPCEAQGSFDTGWNRFAPDRRERITVSHPFDAVAARLQDHLHRTGMHRLPGDTQREPILFSVESRKVLISHLWLAGSHAIAPFSAFFACGGGKPVAMAAGTLFVIEQPHGTEVEFHLGFAASEVTRDACTLRPGLLARLAGSAGIL